MSAGVLKMSSHPQNDILLGCCYGKLHHPFQLCPCLGTQRTLVIQWLIYSTIYRAFLLWQSHEPRDRALYRIDKPFPLRRLTGMTAKSMCEGWQSRHLEGTWYFTSSGLPGFASFVAWKIYVYLLKSLLVFLLLAVRHKIQRSKNLHQLFFKHV